MPISEARHRANEKYNAKAYEEIKIRVKKGRKEEIQAKASKNGESVNAFINRAIDQLMNAPGGTFGFSEGGNDDK